MTRNMKLAAGTLALLGLLGCGGSTSEPQSAKTTSTKPPASAPAVKSGDSATDEVAAERSKLSPEDRALVDAQEWCVVNEEGRLGSMGEPVKLTIKGQPVFLCCAGCKRKAEADPDKTLARVEELKSKAKTQRSSKG
jgi:hypothetical protein